MWLIWAIISIVCVGMELTSGGFYILCFAVSALLTIPFSLFIDSIPWQIFIFCVASVLSLLLLRPALYKLDENRKKKNGQQNRHSNADALIGQTGFVTETIAHNDFGRVQLDGDYWKARSINGDTIEKGSKVKIVARESIILIVDKI